ncbi:MAG: hypothetical protein A3A80_04490 [Candidatus Terrybacteria bacterium RIFCSPLOWO2_01_FULL_44_24]|uniref:Uncharacterized protein n=1 Tax=Candidatus Terrybacteria bacterium RIFCSPHIGHO2_01_FULL_43_35 TaxID=1802361 RepID=A0A1G2PE65_9BACT|nr:MAG: hypothetical protein A2828_01365 [Candidatus Terrybacteria bacterium RIFCSPHIGHO2_01_FULL_43_35]OHA49678.1 MAG: hypothetical protein A3B75_01145 [Candidatus Terrybacteria bacterium RIFCSPHIGHO2_02_FULL_43_14]OHA51343.1 MAG: hypothetical protein A3A80_04490 [Candidatus Terrybacteria bacterium RIFCSPLOWO2_01_FULL_44_24]
MTDPLDLFNLLPEEDRDKISADAQHIILLRAIKRAHDAMSPKVAERFLKLFHDVNLDDQIKLAFLEEYMPDFPKFILQEAENLRKELSRG